MRSIWRIIAPVFGLMGARLGGAAFGFLSQLVLARAFPPAQVGLAFLAISVTTFVSLLITGGYHTIGLTYLARFQSFGRPGLVEGFLSAARRDMLLLAVIAFGVAGLLLLMPGEPGIAQAAFCGTLAAIPLAGIRLNNSMANAQRRFALSYAPDFVFRPGLLLVFIAALVVLGTTQSALPVLLALPAIALAVAIGQARLLGPDNVLRPDNGPVRRDLRKFYRSRALAMLAVTIVSGATADLVIMVGSLFLDPEAVAILGVAIRIAALVGFFALASQQFVLRDLVGARASGDQSAVDRLLLRTNLAGAGTMVAAMAGTLMLGPWVLSLFGAHYGSAYWPMLIFLVSQGVRVAGGMNAQLLALEGYQTRSAVTCLVALLVLGLGSAVLAPLWGLVGIALATLLAEVVWATGLGILAQRLVGRRGDLCAALTHRNY